MEVKDKVVVVTGGASGIGEGLCRRFSREGAKKVIVADVNEARARIVATEINGLAMPCDVRNEEDIIRLVNFTEDKFGLIDLFCSNAGIIFIGDLGVKNEDWQRIWEINVLAHVFVARAVIPGMIKRGGGALLVTASAAGLLSQIGSLPYSVTKHAAVGLAENISITYGDQGIKVFLLCPQAVRSEMTKQGGGVAAVDGLMEPEQLADEVINGLKREEFLILPHPEVKIYMQRKVTDYDRWLLGMRRLQARFMTGAPLKK
ncbi:MAG TPA: SDR family oxidoreductase [Smithellaceae bacterium]|nr:MAG: D-beta-hydroxybutyrate dehydrogenase [Deltaproteobacteria bacterium ADurb.BinA014]HQG23712.1 SDR family oxidoreductase [Smithellaceae bacterium]